ncbi:MAG: 3'(2'),5'-bisphosphate nucleotidase CysQ [Actinomycetia bacterium]|nr:3'(2'),5'-bisphosphate nucleotidase CysQ [Actinomycetes bacterium]MCP4084286.1 3'(2'),5'-bisphosphate nucleotidase CysQ [Actinomycetes bacterium]
MSASPRDHEVAARIATEAGYRLVELREKMVLDGTTWWELQDQGDSQAHHWIMDQLATDMPDDAVLSEEGADDRSRLDYERCWIIDPLDGTREFSEPPRTDWAVHVALVENGEPIAGSVALPALDMTLSSDPAPELPPPSNEPARIIVSRSRPPVAAQMLARELGGQLLPMGSAGAKAMAVVLGHADIYAHSGGQYEWDNCAPAVVAQAAGLHVSRIDGSPMVYNNPDPWLPDLLICRKEWAQDCLAIING